MEYEIDDSVVQRARNAVEHILLNSDLDKGLEDAFMSLLALGDFELPEELRSQFNAIEKRYDEEVEKAYIREPQLRNSPTSSLVYAGFASRTKAWFKKAIWELYREMMEGGDAGLPRQHLRPTDK